MLLVEIFARFFLQNRYHGIDPYIFYYPKLKSVRAINYSPDTLKIALLGSSVTATEIISHSIKAELENTLHSPVRVYNLSYIGGTIQDAWYLYKWTGKSIFQGIIIYQGIGELRMNRYFEKVPSDFSSISWFRRRQDVDRFYSPYFQTPCAIAYMLTTRLEKAGKIHTNWNLGNGAFTVANNSSKNVGIDAFTKTYRKLIRLAHSRKEHVFALSFAFSDTLNQPAFKRLADEYTDSIRAVAKDSSTFVDMSDLTNRHALFSEFYHLTQEGQILFSTIAAKKISAQFEKTMPKKTSPPDIITRAIKYE